MAGVTDVAFRALAKEYGAAMTYTEFVSSAAIVRGNVKTLSMLQVDPSEKPVAVQLFGGDVSEVVEAAKLLEDKFDVIDINCGCPAFKVIKTGAGSALLKEPSKIAGLISKLVGAVSKPISVKIRAGVSPRCINAVEVAKLVEDAGAAAVAVHGRTQGQGYKGEADWGVIKSVKEAVNIPVIGNGDVFTPEVFKQRLDYSGVDYIMIARGAIGNPYLFKQINDYLDSGKYDKLDKYSQFFSYLVLAEKYKLIDQVVKTQAATFTKGLVGGRKMRDVLISCKDSGSIKEVMLKFQNMRR